MTDQLSTFAAEISTMTMVLGVFAHTKRANTLRNGYLALPVADRRGGIDDLDALKPLTTVAWSRNIAKGRYRLVSRNLRNSYPL